MEGNSYELKGYYVLENHVSYWAQNLYNSIQNDIIILLKKQKVSTSDLIIKVKKQITEINTNTEMHHHSNPFIAAKNPPVVDSFNVICPVIYTQYVDHFLRCP